MVIYTDWANWVKNENNAYCERQRADVDYKSWSNSSFFLSTFSSATAFICTTTCLENLEMSGKILVRDNCLLLPLCFGQHRSVYCHNISIFLLVDFWHIAWRYSGASIPIYCWGQMRQGRFGGFIKSLTNFSI